METTRALPQVIDLRAEGMAAVSHFLDIVAGFGSGRMDAPVPVAYWRHHPVADQRAETLVAATCKFQQDFRSDLVKITPASSFQLRDLGQEDAWTGDSLGRRVFGAPAITQPEDWLRLAETSRNARHVSEHLQAARAIRAGVSPEVPVLQSIFDPLFQARTLSRGVWRHHLQEHPEAVVIGLSALCARTKRLIHDFREAGVDGIFLAIQHAGAGEDPEGDYWRLGLPDDLACLAETGPGALNFVHLHGHDHPPALARAFPEAILHFSPDDNPVLWSEALKAPDLSFSAGPRPDWLATATVSEIITATRTLREQMRGRIFTLGAGCVLRPDTPDLNIHAALAAARCPVDP